MRIYVVLDIPAGIFSAPMLARNDIIASRQLVAGLKESDQDPSQFQLFYVGDFFDDIEMVQVDGVFSKPVISASPVPVHVYLTHGAVSDPTEVK